MGVLRDKYPFFYVIIVLLLSGIAGVYLFYRTKDTENKELRAENKELVKSIIESNRLGTQAITSQSEVMRVMHSDLKDVISRFDTRTEKILTTIAEIKSKVEK